MLRLVLALMLSCVVCGATADERIPIVDAHSQVAEGIAIDRVLSLMNEAGVSRTILAGRGTSARDVVAAARLHPWQIIASINMKYPPEVLRERPDDALDRIRRAGEAPDFGAISEAMICHEQKGRRAPEILRDFDAPEIREAFTVAQQRRWPFVVHIEFAYARSLGRYDEYMRALEDFLARHPQQPVALTHMGQLEAGEARRLIEAHPNVYFLTSHSNPVFLERRREKHPWTNLFAGNQLAPAWRDLVLLHPERFVLAFDNVYNADWGNFYLQQVQLWREALAKLPPNVENAVAHGNAERLWRLRSPPGSQGKG